MDGFWTEVEWIQQRDELKEENSRGSEGRLPEGEEPRLGPAGRKGGSYAGEDMREVQT